MDTALAVALIAGAVSVASAVIAVLGQRQSAELAATLQRRQSDLERAYQREESVALYRDPLAAAAFDLQSRLYNILRKDFFRMYYVAGGERERSYAIANTVFLIGQYFAWSEIIRRVMQYLDLGSDTKTQTLSQLQSAINSVWSSDRFDARLRIFAGEQRAIGEAMIELTPRGPECIGYGAFLEKILATSEPTGRVSLLSYLEADVRALASGESNAQPRLVALQHSIIDLLEMLDPNFVRFPQEQRSKVDGQGIAGISTCEIRTGDGSSDTRDRGSCR